jgi:chitodextrinase
MSQKGFANIFLIVVIVAIIAFGGYMVFSKKLSSVPTTTQLQSTNSQSNQQMPLPDINKGMTKPSSSASVSYDEKIVVCYPQNKDCSAYQPILNNSVQDEQDEMETERRQRLQDEMETERRQRLYESWLAAHPPQWSGDAWLAADRVTPTSVQLRWSAARDLESEVSSYRIFADDASVGEVSGTITAFQVTGLTGGRHYRFSVQAQDTDGNWSDDGPVLELTTPTSGVIVDNAPPTWPGGRLTATEITQNSVRLHWQGAVDSGTGVVAYRVFQTGPALEGQVPADQDSFQVTGLASGTFYRFFVQAGDALGHWSTDGPSIVIRTELDPNTGPPSLWLW